MATITATQLTSAGLDFTNNGTAADALGDEVAARANLCLAFQNADTDSTTITIAVPGTSDGNTISDVTLTVAADDTGIVRLNSGIYTNSSGNVTFTYSDETALSVIAFYL